MQACKRCWLDTSMPCLAKLVPVYPHHVDTSVGTACRQTGQMCVTVWQDNLGTAVHHRFKHLRKGIS